jgi:hypothetical protein
LILFLFLLFWTVRSMVMKLRSLYLSKIFRRVFSSPVFVDTSTSAFIKILLNFTQILSMISSLINLQEFSIENYLNIFLGFKGGAWASSRFSLDCLIPQS